MMSPSLKSMDNLFDYNIEHLMTLSLYVLKKEVN